MDFFSNLKWNSHKFQTLATKNIRYALKNKEPIAIYGAGNLGSKIYAKLKKNVVCFIDDTFKKGSTLNGLPIYSPEDAYLKYQEELSVVICIYSPKHSYFKKKAVIKTLYRWRVLSFSELCHLKKMDYYYIGEFESLNEKKYRKLYKNLADGHSRNLLNQHLNYKLISNFDFPVSLDTRNDILISENFDFNNICYIDCGAYNGDTIMPFICNENILFNKYFAIEPDSSNYKLLNNYVVNLPEKIRTRITLLNKAIHTFDGKVNFSSDNSTGSSINKLSNLLIDCINLNFFNFIDERCFIKMDIEGAELSSLSS
jgi:FkbM family methyltransferase